MFGSLKDNDEIAIDCEIACDCVKRANVVLGLRREIFARTHTATHELASAQRLKVTIVTSTRALVAVLTPRLPIRDKRRHRNCFHTRPLQAYSKSNHLWGQGSVDTIKFGYTLNYIDLHAQRQGFRAKKEPFPRSEFTLALNLDIVDTGRSPNAVRDHAGTTQVDFEVDRPPPADSPPGDLLITMIKETVILYKKEFWTMKKS